MDIVSSTSKIFVVRLANALIVFAGTALFARELGPGPLGVFFLFESLLSLSMIPSDVGFRGAATKRISEGDDADEFLTMAVLLKAVPFVLVAAAILAFEQQVNSFVGLDVAPLLVLAIFLQEIGYLMTGVLRGELRVGETAHLFFLRQLLWVAVGVALVALGAGAKALIYGTIVGLGGMVAWGWVKKSTKFGRPSVEHARSLVDFGKYNFVGTVGGEIHNWMDVIVLGFFVTQTQVGIYETAWRVTLVVMLFSESISKTIFPQTSAWQSEGEHERIEALLSKSVLASVFLVFPAVVGTLVLSREIMGVVFGPEFVAAWLVLVVLMAGKLHHSVFLILDTFLFGTGKQSLGARAIVTSVLSNVALNVLLVWQFGVIGAAVATTAASAIGFAIAWRYVKDAVHLRLPYRELGWCGVSSAVMGIGLAVVRSAVAVDTLPVLLLVVTAGAAVYFSLLASYSPIRHKLVRTAHRVV